jgi:hypothetical protein
MPDGFKTLPSNSIDRASPISRWLSLELQPAHFRLALGVDDRQLHRIHLSGTFIPGRHVEKSRGLFRPLIQV